MRVEAVETIPTRAQGAGSAPLDAAASLAVKNLVAALENEDSLFDLLEPLRGLASENSGAECMLSAELVLGFKERHLADHKNLHLVVVAKLIELLRDERSKDTLEAKICVIAGKDKQDATQNALCIQLAAKGHSTEQAMLRWSLGLAQVQQAVLFTSRYVRQQQAAGSGN
jgi:hypothetical protein